MLLKKLLGKFHNFPAHSMIVSLERQDLCNIDTVIFQEVTKIAFYGTKYGLYYSNNLSGFNSI